MTRGHGTPPTESRLARINVQHDHEQRRIDDLEAAARSMVRQHGAVDLAMLERWQGPRVGPSTRRRRAEVVIDLLRLDPERVS